MSVSVCVCVCLSVCASASKSQTPHVATLPNISYMSSMTVARFSSGGVAIYIYIRFKDDVFYTQCPRIGDLLTLNFTISSFSTHSGQVIASLTVLEILTWAVPVFHNFIRNFIIKYCSY